MIFLHYFSLFIYNLTIASLSLYIRLTSCWNQKHLLWLKGRKDIFEKIKSSLKADEKRIWIHCSSLGEFEQGRPLIELLKKEYPVYSIVLTFFSPSGYEIRKNYPYADYVFYLPTDSRKNASKFIKLINPQLVIFVKYEFWYYYYSTLYKNKIPLLLISAIFNHNKIFFKPWGTLYRKILTYITYIFVQDEHSMQLLHGIGIKHVGIAPDTRIDRVLQISNEGWKSDLEEVEDFCGNNHVLIAGSSYQSEEEMIFSLMQHPNFDWKVIIAPHHTNKEHIQNILHLYGKNSICWSDIKKGNLPLPVSHYRVLIIDTIGLLAHLYKYASVAFIGGGFGKSIHNILEPATFGLPVIIGPKNHETFKEAVDLKNLGGVFIVNSFEDFKSSIQKLTDDTIRSAAGSVNRKYILDHSGGTKKVLEKIELIFSGHN